MRTRVGVGSHSSTSWCQKKTKMCQNSPKKYGARKNKNKQFWCGRLLSVCADLQATHTLSAPSHPPPQDLLVSVGKVQESGACRCRWVVKKATVCLFSTRSVWCKSRVSGTSWNSSELLGFSLLATDVVLLVLIKKKKKKAYDLQSSQLWHIT